MNNLQPPGECQIYPGGYCAMPQLEKLLETQQLPGKAEGAKPLVNMQEYNNFFTIKIAMPGLKRENIFAFIDDNILSIIALKQRPRENGVMKMHEIETDFLERYILIPRSADMAFVSAEYSDGMLAFQIPKGTSGNIKNCNPIVVY